MRLAVLPVVLAIGSLVSVHAVRGQYLDGRAGGLLSPRVQARELLRRGHHKMKAGDYRGAVRLFRRSLRIEARFATAVRLAVALERSGLLRPAIVEYQRTLASYRAMMTPLQQRNLEGRIVAVRARLRLQAQLAPPLNRD